MKKLHGLGMVMGALSMISLGGCAATTEEDLATSAQPILYSPAPTAWESGNFARLPSLGGVDLQTFIEGLPHPAAYSPLSPAQMSAVHAMFDAIDAATTQMLAGSQSVDWCAVVSTAEAAGYNLYRLYDTPSQRWLIVGLDGLGNFTQATFVINPGYRRDLVVELPHVETGAGIEDLTDTEGVLIFRQTAARALLMNGADRCSGPEGAEATCDGTVSSDSVCPGQSAGTRYRPSDTAHNDDSAFYALHQRFNDVWTSSRFVQLHGNESSQLNLGGVSVSDGRHWTTGASGIASTFVANLIASGMSAANVNDCTNELEVLCGYRNAEGRYTNDANATCGGYSMAVGGQRFLHLEQRAGSGNVVQAPAPIIAALNLTVSCLNGVCAMAPQSTYARQSACGVTF